MAWKDILDKIKLVEMKNSLKTDQAGVVNVKVENNNYTYNIQNPSDVSTFINSDISEKIEIEVKKQVVEKLRDLSASLDILPERTQREVLSGVTLSTGIDFLTLPPTTDAPEEE